jgi:hypothetical protein
MSCLLALIALITPRLVIVLVWLLSDWFDRVFDTALWPILGFVFLPTTLLWYTAVQNWWGGEWSFWTIAGLVIALVIDTSPASGKRGRR